jgi:putative membrane protein (TIGR04086 family)
MATTISRKAGTRKFGNKAVPASGVLGAVGGVVSGVLTALIVTLVGVVLFALLIRWVSPSDAVISVINQALKLVAIAVGVWFVTRKGGEGGLLKGAATGFLYMLVGVVAYTTLSRLPIQLGAYLADLGMGVAGGGLCGIILPGLGKK